MPYIIINQDRRQLEEMWDAAKIASQQNKEVAYVFLGHSRNIPNKAEIYGSDITISHDIYNNFLPELCNDPKVDNDDLVEKLEAWKAEFEDSISGGVRVWDFEHIHEIGRQLTEEEIKNLNYDSIKKGIPGEIVAGMEIESRQMIDKYIRGIIHSHPKCGDKSSQDEIFDLNTLSERERLLEKRDKASFKDKASFYSGIIQCVPDPLPFVLYFYWKYLDDVEGLGNVRKQMEFSTSDLFYKYVDGLDIYNYDYVEAIKTNDRAKFLEYLCKAFKNDFCDFSGRTDELDTIKFHIPESVIGDLWRFKEKYIQTFWEIAKLRFVNKDMNPFEDGGIVTSLDDAGYSFNIIGDFIEPSERIDILMGPLVNEYLEIPENPVISIDLFHFYRYASSIYPTLDEESE